MSINATTIAELLVGMAAKKSVFCSEMDFQLNLAWEMKERGWDVSMEYDPSCFDANAAIDIMIQKPHRIELDGNRNDVDGLDEY